MTHLVSDLLIFGIARPLWKNTCFIIAANISEKYPLHQSRLLSDVIDHRRCDVVWRDYRGGTNSSFSTLLQNLLAQKTSFSTWAMLTVAIKYVIHVDVLHVMVRRIYAWYRVDVLIAVVRTFCVVGHLLEFEGGLFLRWCFYWKFK